MNIIRYDLALTTHLYSARCNDCGRVIDAMPSEQAHFWNRLERHICDVDQWKAHAEAAGLSWDHLDKAQHGTPERKAAAIAAEEKARQRANPLDPWANPEN
jgi:hypothetical protein